MKKTKLFALLFVLLACFFTTATYAVPAYPGLITVKQKDGSSITIQVHGDEYFHYTTTSDGYFVAQKEGVYYYADMAFNGEIYVSKVKANNVGSRTKSERAFLSTKSPSTTMAALQGIASAKRASRMDTMQKAFPTDGVKKGVVILVNFKDVKFTDEATAKTRYSNLLNQKGYSENGGTGSAFDFYHDNSMGKFSPQFDIYGPVTLTNNMAFYGGNDSSGDDVGPRQFASDAAAAAAAAGVDFSQYDEDGDGYIDMIFFYYAGHNEAEGGPDDSIWPHKWSVSTGASYNGKIFSTYACTSELKGSDGTVMCGIGTFAHEFGHVLGLQDTYDTDGATGGRSSGMSKYDIMTSGNYNNEGRTPPFYPAFQRYQLGWIEPIEINENKEYKLEHIAKNQAYIIPTSVENEYFMLENRWGANPMTRNWDKYILADPDDIEGMMITHIDKSNNMAGDKSASERWRRNGPNNNTSHECAIPIFANGTKSFFNDRGYTILSQIRDVLYGIPVREFGSSSNPAAIDWSGKALNVNLKNIRVENGIVYFTNEMDMLQTVAYTNGIALKWISVATEYKVSWKEKGSADSYKEQILTNKQFNISGLESDKTYEVKVEMKQGEGYVLVEKEDVKTLVISKDLSPKIIFEYEQNAGKAIFSPILHNANASSVKWFLNGEVLKVEDAKVLTSGVYTVKCEMTVDGKKEFIVKLINVN